MQDANLLLELSNGSWSILAFCACFFLAFHIVDIGERRHIHIRRWFSDLPQSLQVAFGVFTVCLGIAITRPAIWFWRFTTGGDLAHFNDIRMPLIAGAVIGSAGLICIIRVVTRPMQANWPWIAPIVLVALYIAAMLLHRAYS